MLYFEFLTGTRRNDKNLNQASLVCSQVYFGQQKWQNKKKSCARGSLTIIPKKGEAFWEKLRRIVFLFLLFFWKISGARQQRKILKISVLFFSFKTRDNNINENFLKISSRYLFLSFLKKLAGGSTNLPKKKKKT